MNTGTLAQRPWSSIDREAIPRSRHRNRLRAAAALIDAALLSALIWIVVAAVLR